MTRKGTMSQRQVKHTRRSLTPTEKQRLVEARRLIAEEEPEIRSKAAEYKQLHKRHEARRLNG